MRGYTVYRMNYATKEKVEIGCLLDRRGKERGKNLMELLLEARRLFARGSSDAICIVLDAPKKARELPVMGMARGIVSIVSGPGEAGVKGEINEPI